eukprot:1159955-Pelagomonas_calceolata.AAC.4
MVWLLSCRRGCWRTLIRDGKKSGRRTQEASSSSAGIHKKCYKASVQPYYKILSAPQNAHPGSVEGESK